VKLRTAVIAAVIALFYVPSSEADETDRTISIPIRVNEAHQYSVEARIDDADPVWCILDSGGGDRLYLDRDQAAGMGIRPTLTGASSGPNDSKMVQDSRAEVSLEVAGVKLLRQTVLLKSQPNHACVIGQTVFSQYVVEVDYEAPAIRLHDREHFHYSGSGSILPLVLDNANPFVSATLTMPNGKSFSARVAVDTGGGSDIAMFSKGYVDKNDLLNQGLDLSGDHFGDAGQRARFLSARVKRLSVGPFEIPQPVVLFQQVQGFGGSAGPDGLLSGGFLRRFKLFFDYSGHKLILEPDSHFRD
jgi:hypothetical protein